MEEKNLYYQLIIVILLNKSIYYIILICNNIYSQTHSQSSLPLLTFLYYISLLMSQNVISHLLLILCKLMQICQSLTLRCSVLVQWLYIYIYILYIYIHLYYVYIIYILYIHTRIINFSLARFLSN